MKLVIQDDDSRVMYRRAKIEFNAKNPNRFNSTDQYWKMFGEANSMEVIIPKWRGPYPVVEALVFTDKAAYAWFILRYS